MPQMRPAEYAQKGQKLLETLRNPALLSGNEFQILGSGKQGDVVVRNPAKPIGERIMTGQYFIKLPKKVSERLPGSAVMAEDFLKEFGQGDLSYSHPVFTEEFYEEGESRTLTHRQTFEGGGSFGLDVFHGSFNPKALKLSYFAAIEGAKESPEFKRQYQKELFDIVKPVLEKKSEYSLRIIEDCIASGDSIAGVLAMLDKTKIQRGDRVRIDVAVATPQGLTVLKRFAEANQLNLEINAGYLGYGLSEGQPIDGVKKVKDHANYIIYPPHLKKNLPKEIVEKIKDYVGVVGDMGEFGAKVADVPWERQRRGERPTGNLDQSKPTILYFANGGYLMKAFKEHVDDLSKTYSIDNEIIFSAKRVWSDVEKYGYGVLVYDLDPRLLI